MVDAQLVKDLFGSSLWGRHCTGKEGIEMEHK